MNGFSAERVRALAWLASLCVAAGQLNAAEGYLLELLAWIAYADRGHPNRCESSD